jgi:hypothetical protein
VHVALPADDTAWAKKFHEDAFGWAFTRRGGPFERWLVSTSEEEEPGIDGAAVVPPKMAVPRALSPVRRE